MEARSVVFYVWLPHPLDDLKAVVGLLHAEQTRTLVGIDVGGVEDQVQFPVEAVKEHTVSAVLVVDKVLGVTPRAVDAAAVADGQSLHIPVLGLGVADRGSV